MAERLASLISRWPHERDRVLVETTLGSDNWRVLFDSGCHDLCHRCEIEKFLNNEVHK